MSASRGTRKRLAVARADRYVQAAELAGVPATRHDTIIGQQQVVIGAPGTDRLFLIVHGTAAGRTRVSAYRMTRGSNEPAGRVKVSGIALWIHEHKP